MLEVCGSGTDPHIATHPVVLVPFGAVLFKKAKGSVVSNRIGTKLGRTVFQVKYASIDRVGIFGRHHWLAVCGTVSDP